MSRMEQQVKIRCESCHGTIDAYAGTKDCLTYDGRRRPAPWTRGQRRCARHEGPDGRLLADQPPRRPAATTSRRPRTRRPDTTSATRSTSSLLYNPKAAYAMGRADGTLDQRHRARSRTTRLVRQGFSHTDNDGLRVLPRLVDEQLHRLPPADAVRRQPGNNYFFSNITGERILLKQANADFTYITPVPMYLGVNSHGKITQISAGMKVFYATSTATATTSQVFRSRIAWVRATTRTTWAATPSRRSMATQMMAHSIRGKVTAEQRGPALLRGLPQHQEQITNFGAQYADFRGIRQQQLREPGLQPAPTAHRPEPGQPAQLAVLRAHGGGSRLGHVPVRRDGLPGQPAGQPRRTASTARMGRRRTTSTRRRGL
jgi:hypothetical protein